MDKHKIEFIVLIIIITLGINYAVYNMYLGPGFQNVKAAEVKYQSAQKKLADLKNKDLQAKQLEEANEKLKAETAKLDEMAPDDLDTPKLIYEFYTACQKFDVTGDDIAIQLSNNSGNTDKTPGSSGSTTQGTTNNTGGNNSAGTNNAANTNQELQLMTLSITLRIHGEASKVEGFLKSVNNISTRRLNVKSVSMNIANPASSTAAKGETAVKMQNLSAVIIFNQYIQLDGKSGTAARNYQFFNEKIGFNKVSDIFSNSSQATR